MLDAILAGGTPLLFHCSAGKDRTGFGAGRAADRARRAVGRGGRRFRGHEPPFGARDTVPSEDLPPDIRESLLRAEPSLLAAAFDAARQQYGSVDVFLADALGLDRHRRSRLQDMLLEPV